MNKGDKEIMDYQQTSIPQTARTENSFLQTFLLLLLVVSPAFLVSCGKKDAGGKPENVDYYTCTMHPSVRSQDPKAKCPICSMDLVPVMKKGSNTANGTQVPGRSEPGKGANRGSNSVSEFTVPVERQQQIGVTYATAQRRPLNYTIRSVGMIAPDKARLFDYVARVSGYVDALHVTSAGEQVTNAEPLLSLYSPDLLTTEQEFVDLLRMREETTSEAGTRANSRLIESAKRRLRLWNVSEQEIAELETTRKPSEFLTFRSPFDGIVQEVNTLPGAAVSMGDRLLQLVDLSVVWLWADFYENEVSLLKIGQPINVTVPGIVDHTFEGNISAIDPFLDPVKRTARVRIDIENPERTLRPGMYANVELTVDRGEGLTIPVGAVLPTGTRMLTFVDKGEGRLEPRFLELGRRYRQMGGRYYDDYYEVTEGLEEGERVVSSANFLIDAESKIQGAVKTWTKEESKVSVEELAKPQVIPLTTEVAPLYKPLLQTYLGIKDLLAKDSFGGVEKAAELRKQAEAIAAAAYKPTNNPAAYRERVQALLNSAKAFKPANLEEARVQFGQLSFDLIALVTQFPPPVGQMLYTMNCPMWKKSPGRWLQASPDIENPFMGQKMLQCGSVVEKIEETQNR